MANLTITLDDEILKRARLRALEMGTSVNAILAEYLTRFARVREQQVDAIDRILSLARAASEDDLERARRRGGRLWRRDDLHDR